MFHLPFFKKRKKKIDFDIPIHKVFEGGMIIKELPSPDEIERLSIKYPLIPGFAFAHIFWSPEHKSLIYQVIEPRLSEEEKRILELIKEKIIESIDVDLFELTKKEIDDYITAKVNEIIKSLGIKIGDRSYYNILYYIYRDTVGLGKIEPLMHDPYIEDISCDGVGIPVYVYHRKYGYLRTNIIFGNEHELQKLIILLAQRSGKYISYAQPYLDAILPDGSRINATFAKDVTTRGPTFTIRKYRKNVLSPVDLIQYKTLNLSIASYLWWAVEHGANIIIGGETASGKTTLLNSILLFAPKYSKIITIEDTRELRLFHENWIPAITREGYGPPDSSGRRFGEVTMFDLLKESFRQNPDYVIVGEVRGEEAYILFQGMASGHSCMSTIHADTVNSVVRRLISPPINLPVELIGNVDLFIFMTHAKEISPEARRIREISEVSGVDIKTSRVITNKAYTWLVNKDSYYEEETKILFRKISERKGVKIRNINKELEKRKKYLELLLRIKPNAKEFFNYINEYYVNPKKAIKKLEDATENY